MAHLDNPAALVESAYARIQAEVMADVPILNPALSVASVGFARAQDHWQGIVITPWCMSLLRIPAVANRALAPADGNGRRFESVGSLTLAFLDSHTPELGEFLSCSLISPMQGFTTQQDALETARTILATLERPLVSEKSVTTPEVSQGRRRFLALAP